MTWFIVVPSAVEKQNAHAHTLGFRDRVQLYLKDADPTTRTHAATARKEARRGARPHNIRGSTAGSFSFGLPRLDRRRAPESKRGISAATRSRGARRR